jgi:hypothetical protein
MNPTKIFVRIVSHKYFMNLINEAIRVDYIVEGEQGHYQVKDPATGEQVFNGIKHTSGKWITSFSTLYWQEPSLS